MATVRIEGKSITLPDDVVKKGKAAVRALLAVNGFPAATEADIEIVGAETPGGPAIVNVTPRATTKGACASYDDFIEALSRAPEYINPAIRLAAEQDMAEQQGDAGFAEEIIRDGRLERAVLEGSREGKQASQMLSTLCYATPQASKYVPEGF